MYSQVPKWTLSPSPNQILLSFTPQAETKSLVSDEKGLNFDTTKSNFAFITGPLVPTRHRNVRFNKHQFGVGGGGGAETVERKGKKKRSVWKDLSVTVPEKIGGGLRAILQGVTGEVSVIARPSGSGRTTFFDALAERLGLNTRQTTEILINGQQQNLASGTSDLEREISGEGLLTPTITISKEIGDTGKIDTETKILKKPRFLCLHGFRTSSEILQSQLRRWPKTVREKFDLVFLDGPCLAQGKSMVDGFYDPPYYEWFQFSEDYQEVYNFEECLAYIEDFMIKHGPFDGLMGFSQGGIISATLPGMQLDGTALTKVPPIKYVIIMSGGKFGGSKFCLPKLATNAFSSPVKCPSLHIIGETCFFKDLGIELLDAFVDPFVINHSKGHTIARLDQKGLKTMLDFIEKIKKI